jgi:hypothetical protein
MGIETRRDVNMTIRDKQLREKNRAQVQAPRPRSEVMTYRPHDYCLIICSPRFLWEPGGMVLVGVMYAVHALEDSSRSMQAGSIQMGYYGKSRKGGSV